jgi:hypothetical protein
MDQIADSKTIQPIPVESDSTIQPDPKTIQSDSKTVEPDPKTIDSAVLSDSTDPKDSAIQSDPKTLEPDPKTIDSAVLSDSTIQPDPKDSAIQSDPKTLEQSKTVESDSKTTESKPKIHDTLADLQKSTCSSVKSMLPEMETDIIYPLAYAKDPFLKNLWEVTLKNLKDASKPLEILEAIAGTAMLEGYIAKFATSVLEGVITDNDMRDMLVNGIKTFTTTKLAGLSLEQYGKVSKVIESSASSPDLAMLMIQQLGKAMVKPDAAAIRRQLGKLNTDCSAESKADDSAVAARKQEIMSKEEAARIDRANADQDYQRTQTTRQERSERLKKEFKELELKKKEAEKAETTVEVAEKATSSETPPEEPVPVESTATVPAPPESMVVPVPTAPPAESTTPKPPVAPAESSVPEVVPAPPANAAPPADVVPAPPATTATTTEAIPAPPANAAAPAEAVPAPTATTAEAIPVPPAPPAEAALSTETSNEKKGGQKTRRRGERQRKTRKHWLLFTLRDIL